MPQDLLFSTPLWSWYFPDAQSLIPLCLRVKHIEDADPEGLQRTNQGGWHSQTNLLEDKEFSKLFTWIAEVCNEAFLETGWDMTQATPRFNNAWAMVSRSGHGLRAHLHPNSLFSGVFYLAAPEGCGDIAFLDPRNGSQVLNFPQIPLPCSGLWGGRVVKRPKQGLLLLFPSWLWHEVEPSKSSESRVSISFNIGLQKVVRS